MTGSRRPDFSRTVAETYDESRAFPPDVLTKLQQTIASAAPLQHGSRIFEAGAGTGAIAGAFLGRGYRYCAVDAAPAMLHRFHERAGEDVDLDLILADLCSLPLSNGAFDAALAIRVFGVIPGWRRAIDECLRVLRPGAALFAGRVHRESDSWRDQIREKRNALLQKAGIETGRLGATEHEYLPELESRGLIGETLPPIRWEAEATAERMIDQSLTGWRIQKLDGAARARLRDQLRQMLKNIPAEPVREIASLQLHVFR